MLGQFLGREGAPGNLEYRRMLAAAANADGRWKIKICEVGLARSLHRASIADTTARKSLT
jgi:hypothetical protein